MVPSNMNHSLQYDFQYGMLQYNNKYHIGNSNTFKNYIGNSNTLKKSALNKIKRDVKEAL